MNKKDASLNSTSDGSFDIDSTSAEKISYTREWLEYDYVDQNLRERFEIYISNRNDTISFQKLVFKKNKLDTTVSTFYNLKTDFLEDNIIKGTLQLFLEDDYKIKSPIIQREIGLNFIQHLNDQEKIIEFKSKNQNYVEFEFSHQSDTLTGVLWEYREIDTLMNGEQMVRIIEYMMPIDNKVKTDNAFIEAFELNKNER